MILPSAWKEQLGALEFSGEIQIDVVKQDNVRAKVYGPVRVQIRGFRPICSEVAFVEIHSTNGKCLIGHLVLAQSQAEIVVNADRLVRGRRLDLKKVVS